MENLTNSPSLACAFFFVCEGIEEFTISIIFLSCFHSANIKATKPYFFYDGRNKFAIILGVDPFPFLSLQFERLKILADILVPYDGL